MDKFEQATKSLTEMYQREWELKQSICENICHSQSKDELMFMLASWSHEPYLDEITMLNIDAMVAETGHVPPT